MSSQNAMLTIHVARFAFFILLAFVFWKRKLHQRFPAMGAYLGLQAASAPMLLYLMYDRMQHGSGSDRPDSYFVISSVVYMADAVLLYFICTEVFRSALSPFSGLLKFGSVIFRWVALISVIIGLSMLPFGLSTIFSNPQVSLIAPSIAFGLTRSVSILELCLLTFLCLSMNALRLSVRDAAFGISLGFGVVSASEFVQSLLTTIYTSMTAPIHLAGEVVVLAVLCIWVVYFALPEPARKPILMPANSTIYRWNEIASALGHTGTRVAVQQPASGFFLADVERVVEKVLARNLKSSESGS
jgi:hypothetical protein